MSKKFKEKAYLIVEEKSDVVCPTCNLPAQQRIHSSTHLSYLNQFCYYKKWYYCKNYECPTKQFQFKEDAVYTGKENPPRHCRTCTCE